MWYRNTRELHIIHDFLHDLRHSGIHRLDTERCLSCCEARGNPSSAPQDVLFVRAKHRESRLQNFLHGLRHGQIHNLLFNSSLNALQRCNQNLSTILADVLPFSLLPLSPWTSDKMSPIHSVPGGHDFSCTLSDLHSLLIFAS